MTHDYTKRSWGHDYSFQPIEKGAKGTMMGWGRGIKKGDYLLIQNGNDSTRYRVTSIKYKQDPRDMWSANVTFAPRKRRVVIPVKKTKKPTGKKTKGGGKKVC